MLYHQGDFYQEGRGLGNVLIGLSRVLRPLFSKAAPIISKVISSPTGQALKNRALASAAKAGSQILADVASGENVGKSLKRGIQAVGADVLETGIEKLRGGGKRRKAVKYKNSAKKRKWDDIFD